MEEMPNNWGLTPIIRINWGLTPIKWTPIRVSREGVQGRSRLAWTFK